MVFKKNMIHHLRLIFQLLSLILKWFKKSVHRKNEEWKKRKIQVLSLNLTDIDNLSALMWSSFRRLAESENSICDAHILTCYCSWYILICDITFLLVSTTLNMRCASSIWRQSEAQNSYHSNYSVMHAIFNRPGVAGAVL